ncbi:MAG: rhamnogalacturonan acetylesterase [Sphingobacterium sp.]|uniref:rhamnogalacturonan acetylesterase n=1 Tax=Sphingobacterium sp. JB170 TaxID=1434842 RepID=UPI000B35EF80|nr:rhamnogalacturonan acetylesterase [Sphingobacterium sp. JB170]
MHKNILVCLALILTAFLFSSFLLPLGKPTIWMIGDSTMAIKQPDKFPETGWGVAFAEAFNHQVTVDNRARNGRSTKSFISQGLWDEVAQGMKEGDYLFIQFGHNDEKIHKPSTGAAIDEFKKNLAFFVQQIRRVKGTPVLLSPIARRKFQNGVLVDTHGQYPGAVKQVADSLQVTFIDLTSASSQMLAQAGEESSKAFFLQLAPGEHENYPEGVIDNTHLNTHGARAVSDIVTSELKRMNDPLAAFLKN